MYKRIEPVNIECEVTGYNPDGFKNVGLWENQNSGNKKDPDKVLCLSCFVYDFLDNISDDPNKLRYYEEAVFEDETEVNISDDYVFVNVNNQFGRISHKFNVEIKKNEDLEQGNPNTATPGSSGIYYTYELDSDMADVEIIQPADKSESSDYRSKYYLDVAKKSLEGKSP